MRPLRLAGKGCGTVQLYPVPSPVWLRAVLASFHSEAGKSKIGKGEIRVTNKNVAK